MTVHKNEVYYVDLSPVIGSEQGGTRPVLVIQNDVGNKVSPTIIVAAITSRQKKLKMPTHVSITMEDGRLPTQIHQFCNGGNHRHKRQKPAAISKTEDTHYHDEKQNNEHDCTHRR